jgi:hypothetical protein
MLQEVIKISINVLCKISNMFARDRYNFYRRLFKIQSQYILQFEVENCDYASLCQLYQSNYCFITMILVNSCHRQQCKLYVPVF